MRKIVKGGPPAIVVGMVRAKIVNVSHEPWRSKRVDFYQTSNEYTQA